MNKIDEKKSCKNFTRRKFMQITAITSAAMSVPWAWTSSKEAMAAAPGVIPTVKDPRFSVPVIDPVKIGKFVDPLPIPGADWPLLDIGTQSIRLIEKRVQILPSTLGLQTTVWCYRGDADYGSTFLGPTMKAISGIPSTVTYDYSKISATTHLLKNGANTTSVVDKHVHGTDAGEPEVRFIAHLHGGKAIKPQYDGYAEAWVTPDGVQNIPTENGSPIPNVVPDQFGGTQTHTYQNDQTAGTAWYHDHTLGITRLNVYAGGAGGYIIADTTEAAYLAAGRLPDLGIPLIIQDRMFYPDGRLAYPDLDAVAAGLIAQNGCTPWTAGDVSTRPEYFGDVILVNGRTWPFLTVEPRIYRFRFLNGCNSRVLDLSFQSPQAVVFEIIGTEGGFLPGPSDKRLNLVIGGAERFDVLIDFRKFVGQTLTLSNKGAKKPYPGGKQPNPQSDALVMQFRVALGSVGLPLAPPPVRWNPVTPPASGTINRGVLLYEGRDQFGRIQPLLGTVSGKGPAFTAQPKFWDDPVTETPRVGTVEIWEIYNTTVDSHPVHIHEVLFRVLNRQPIAFNAKLAAGVCNVLPPSFPITLGGAPVAAVGYETGFKDTVLCPPGQVTRVVVDFRTVNSGRFVWHCHILEHEEHEMMRPYDIS